MSVNNKFATMKKKKIFKDYLSGPLCFVSHLPAISSPDAALSFSLIWTTTSCWWDKTLFNFLFNFYFEISELEKSCTN